jgi:hypothetical protein
MRAKIINSLLALWQGWLVGSLARLARWQGSLVSFLRFALGPLRAMAASRLGGFLFLVFGDAGQGDFLKRIFRVTI